ncbi:MAG: YidC/Oxa1 family membrane protein insertase, partial [Parasporobacterium sp.]|nr:YidC/Oxa1 family membrane protein insertase [Parasporobacterium sp.]
MLLNFLIAGCAGGSNAAAATGGCYDWPGIKQIIIAFSWVMEFLYDKIGIANIGLVIIIFTLIVKFVLLPLTIKQQKFSKLSSIMQPEIKAIQAKYKGRNDQYSMQAMQAETKAVYAKYGVSQAGGCLQTFIQMPIIIALYGAIRQLPTVLEALKTPLVNIGTVLNSAAAADPAIKTSLTAISSGILSTDVNTQVTTLYTLPTKSWEAMSALFTPGSPAYTTLSENFTQMKEVNSFCGFDLSQTPWNIMLGGGLGIFIVLIPLLAGFAQWLSFKLTQAAGASGDQGDALGGASKTMGLIMPLFSVFFCFTLNSGLGLYWCASSIFQVVLQILL